jgi:hypothetical protein
MRRTGTDPPLEPEEIAWELFGQTFGEKPPEGMTKEEIDEMTGGLASVLYPEYFEED